MAKVLKMQSEVDVAEEELTDLRIRLDTAQRNRADYKEQLDQVLAERLGPEGEATDGSTRMIELRDLVIDSDDLAKALKTRIEERQVELIKLKGNQARGDANLLVGQAMESFKEVIDSFAYQVSQAELWLGNANEAARDFARANPGLGSVNQKLVPRLEVMAEIIRHIKVGSTL